jgi:hypothetical protein
MKQLTIINPDVAIKLTTEQAKELQIDTSQDQISGELKTVGVWGIPVSFRALCITKSYDASISNNCTNIDIYGLRTMSNVRSAGYHLEGQVSVGGKKYSCFTSTQLFEVDGKLIDVATIYARI